MSTNFTIRTRLTEVQEPQRTGIILLPGPHTKWFLKIKNKHQKRFKTNTLSTKKTIRVQLRHHSHHSNHPDSAPKLSQKPNIRSSNDSENQRIEALLLQKNLNLALELQKMGKPFSTKVFSEP